ncbi:MAG TPA: prenyltransferase/squalene oxidase repeat-containing protein [bacterium]|nr:prenyltransferase/squalene oxidase repeat-containing protein [bacterium]
MMRAVSVLPYDWRLTIAAIDQNGTEMERARLRGILGRPRPDTKIIRTIEARQNEDGGFPHQMASGRLSTIDATTTALEWLWDLGLAESPYAERACTYLLSTQRPDGAWDEPPGVLRYSPPPPRLLPGDPRVRCRATALVAFWLARAGYRGDAPRRGVDYVAARQAPDGRVLGFRETTWLLAAASSLLEGPASAAAVRALESLAAVPDSRWSAGALAGLLDCLGAAGLSRSVAVIARGADRLRALVRPDGTWLSEEGEAYHTDVTLSALRALVLHGAVEPADLPAGTRPAVMKLERPAAGAEEATA